jgi:hypothetical protein
MSAAVEDAVRALGGLDLEGLREAWRHHCGAPTRLRSCQLLRLALAWRLQAGQSGGLDSATRRRLREGVHLERSAHVSCGVIIVKEWRGETYRIERTASGYSWQGDTYSSLSKVARAITGVPWNGPKFFGLREGAP